jgi:cytochrome P450
MLIESSLKVRGEPIYMDDPCEKHDALRFDPTSPANFADPYPTLRLIQEREALHRSTIGWMVMRYEHAHATLRESRVWGTGMAAQRRLAVLGPGPMFEYASRRLNNYDPPEHTRLRSLVTKGFTARRVEALRPNIQRIADHLLDAVVAEREFDIVEILAHPLPCQVICDLVGVPLTDSPQLSSWTAAVHGALGPAPRSDQIAAAHQAAGEFISYIRALIAKRGAISGDDLLTALIAAEEGGDRLSEEELVSTVLFIFTAGHATTRDLVSAGLLAFMSNRDQWERLVRDPSMAPSAVEECLRYAPSIPLLLRRALQDTTLAGVSISAGETVYVSIAAANRDPRRFPAPDRFDIGRTDNEHLTFGGGIHYCLGAMLGRAEAQIIFATLARRYPRMELAQGPIQWRDTIMFRGPKAVRVRVDN